MSTKAEYIEIPVEEKPLKKEDKISGFNWIFLKRLFKISSIILRNTITVIVLILLLGLSISSTYLGSYTGKVIGNFYEVIIARDKHGFYKVLWWSSGVILGLGLLDSTIKFVIEILAWRWRRSLCLHLHSRYFIKSLYYKLTSLDHRVDNPDQRITQDVDNFSSTLSTVVSSCITGPFTIVYYYYLTWKYISWYSPLIITAYFFLGYIVNKLVMTPIVRLVFKQEQLEGDFRFDHIRVRTCAESIAIFDGGEHEKMNAESTFQELLANKMRIVRWHWALNASTNTFAYFGSILNYVVVALPILFISSEIDPTPAYVAQASFTCIMLISGFSQFINVSNSLSDLAGYTTRIAHLLETINDLETKNFASQDAITEHNDNEIIKFTDVSCFSPNGVKLISKLNFVVQLGSNLLIMGPTGVGKSTILRILNGLWPFFEGHIEKPFNNFHSLFYLPQKPYLFTGTIAEQITYPNKLSSYENKDELLQMIKSALDQVKLFKLTKLYNIEKEKINWTDVLSPGEQQLLSFARLLFHKPKFAVLDEATSSLHQEIEEHLYKSCKDYGITVISVGHRNSLKVFHEFLLQLEENRDWKLIKLEKEINKI